MVSSIYDDARTISFDDVTLRVVDTGPRDGEAVLLLHGWPDSANLWRHQIPVLVDAGYRVIAPDQRAFGESDVPADVASTHMFFAVQDAVRILDDSAIERAHVVGHDWGAAVAWGLGFTAPDRVISLTAMSVGHPAAFSGAGFPQREKSWYMLLFQFEGVAEQWLSDNDWAGLRAWTRDEPEIEQWIPDLSRPGRLTASLNWYRATVPPESLLGGGSDLPPVTAPTLGIWSSDDMALVEAQMTDSQQYVSGEWRYERLDGVGHWMPVAAPERVNALLLEWIGKHPAS